MAEDNEKIVQPDVVPEGTPSTEGAEQQPPEPSPEEKMAEMIKTQIASEVEKVMGTARREIQSVKDKSKAEVETAVRRTQLAEGTLGATHKHLQQLDPETAKEAELAELRAREQGRLTIEQEEAGKKVQTDFLQSFYSNLNQFITGLEIDPNDKKIDWGNETMTPLEVQRRVLDSVSKIQKENIQTAQGGLEKRLKELEGKVGQANVEANSVSTETSSGVAAGPDAVFVKKMGSGEMPLTKENRERLHKIQESYE